MADEELGEVHAQALELLSKAQEAVEAPPEDGRSSEELLVQRLVVAAEALNLGVDEQAIREVGKFSHFSMREVYAVAAEFRADDDEVDGQVRARRLRISQR